MHIDPVGADIVADMKEAALRVIEQSEVHLISGRLCAIGNVEEVLAQIALGLATVLDRSGELAQPIRSIVVGVGHLYMGRQQIAGLRATVACDLHRHGRVQKFCKAAREIFASGRRRRAKREPGI